MFSPPRHPTGLPSYERIHVVGRDKSGKSSVWLSAARLSRLTNSPATFWVIDSDRAVPWMMAADDTNIQVLPAYAWSEYLDSAKTIAAQAKPGDWIVVDLISRAWEKVQDFYVEKSHGDTNEFWARMESMARTEGVPMWQYVIKSKTINFPLCKNWFEAWLEGLVFRLPCHVLFTSEVKDIFETAKIKEREEIKEDWSRFGFKPEGYWRLGYYVHSTAVVQQAGPGDHRVTVKERDYGGRKRAEVVGMRYGDFAVEVMVGKWGWTI